MRLFRSPVLLRLVALLLVGGVGATAAPTAAARDAQASGLRALLDDARAFDAALAAAHAPEAAADPVGAFAEAYAEAAGGDLTADVVRDLLDGQSFGLVAPAAPEAVFAPTPASATAGPSAAVGGPSASMPALVGLSVVRVAVEAAPILSRPEAAQSRPRAP